MKRVRFVDGTTLLVNAVEETFSNGKMALIFECDHLNALDLAGYLDILAENNSSSVDVLREDDSVINTFEGYTNIDVINQRLAGDNMVFSVRLSRPE